MPKMKRSALTRAVSAGQLGLSNQYPGSQMHPVRDYSNDNRDTQDDYLSEEDQFRNNDVYNMEDVYNMDTDTYNMDTDTYNKDTDAYNMGKDAYSMDKDAYTRASQRDYIYRLAKEVRRFKREIGKRILQQKYLLSQRRGGVAGVELVEDGKHKLYAF